MKIQIDKRIFLFEKESIYRNSKRGWSIVIMPDNILIDNYKHGFAHIPPDRCEIKTKDLNDTLKIDLNHIIVS